MFDGRYTVSAVPECPSGCESSSEPADCGETTVEESMRGRLSAGGSDRYEYDTRLGEPCRLAVSLDGPATADLDLYLGRDGTRPAVDDADRRSAGPDSSERVSVGDPGAGETVELLVTAHAGAGSYDLSVTEVGTDGTAEGDDGGWLDDVLDGWDDLDDGGDADTGETTGDDGDETGGGWFDDDGDGRRPDAGDDWDDIGGDDSDGDGSDGRNDGGDGDGSAADGSDGGDDDGGWFDWGGDGGGDTGGDDGGSRDENGAGDGGGDGDGSDGDTDDGGWFDWGGDDGGSDDGGDDDTGGSDDGGWFDWGGGRGGDGGSDTGGSDGSDGDDDGLLGGIRDAVDEVTDAVGGLF